MLSVIIIIIIIIIKLVHKYKNKENIQLWKQKNEEEQSEWCKQAEQCSETNKNVVQLRMIMYNRHTKLNRPW